MAFEALIDALKLSTVLLATLIVASATYLQPSPREMSSHVKTNDVIERDSSHASRRRPTLFKDDLEIRRYLKSHGRQMMIWTCRNAIQHVLPSDHPLPHVDLYCDVIGTVMKVTWHHRGKPVSDNQGSSRYEYSARSKFSSLAGSQSSRAKSKIKPRFQQTITTHSEAGVYYLAWLDFRLRIYNATRRDSGRYQFEVVGHDGEIDKHNVFVDIASPPSGFQRSGTAAGEMASNSLWQHSSPNIGRPKGAKQQEFGEPWLRKVDTTKRQRKHRSNTL